MNDQENVEPQETESPGGDLETKLAAAEAKLQETDKQYKNLEKAFGKQGKELGDLRRMVQESQQAEEAGPTMDDLNAEFTKKVTEGELSLPEAFAEQQNLLRREFMEQFESLYQQKEQEKQAQEFLQANPDFVEFADSEEMQQEFVQANPTLRPLLESGNKLALYYAWKGNVGAQQAYEKGKTEAASLEEGARRTTRVGKSGGQEMSKEPPRLPGKGTMEGALAALRQARERQEQY
jgi:hypothetical protein